MGHSVAALRFKASPSRDSLYIGEGGKTRSLRIFCRGRSAILPAEQVAIRLAQLQREIAARFDAADDGSVGAFCLMQFREHRDGL